jgi:hypothetical protein
MAMKMRKSKISNFVSQQIQCEADANSLILSRAAENAKPAMVESTLPVGETAGNAL